LTWCLYSDTLNIWKGSDKLLKRIGCYDIGGYPYEFPVWECNKCKCETSPFAPHYEDSKNNYHLCWNCAYIESKISEHEYVQCVGIAMNDVHATIRNGEIIVWVGKTPPWEHAPDKIERHSLKYKITIKMEPLKIKFFKGFSDCLTNIYIKYILSS